MRAFTFLLGFALLVPASAGAAPSTSVGDQLLEDVRVLSADDMEGRLAGSEGGAKARAYLLGRLTALGVAPVSPGFAQPFTAEVRGRKVEGTNLVARIEGSSDSEVVLLITAHYDHLGVQKGAIYNGADDNASGVAALLAIAEAFRKVPPKHDVIFALWDAEELGSPGAQAFIDAPPVPIGRIALNMNLDMLSRSDKGELYVAGARHYPFLRARFEKLASAAPVTLKLGHDGPPWKGSDDWTDGSDHRLFHKAGVPFAYFGVEDHPDYHKPTDDFAAIPQDFYRRSAVTVLAAARLLDEELDAIAVESGRR